jgi:hypothetical protein
LRTVEHAFNALTVVGPGVLGEQEALLGATTDGRLFRLSRNEDPMQIGAYGRPSSGDLYYAHDRAWASIDGAGDQDALVGFDPQTMELSSPSVLPGSRMYGFAACPSLIFALDESGDVFAADEGEDFTPYIRTDVVFWGAACRRPPIATVPTRAPNPTKPQHAAGAQPTTQHAQHAQQAERSGRELRCGCD